MKANEFVKQYGVNEAKRIIPICEKQGAGLTVSGYRVNLDDLKRLVESHELVSSYYGLARAKEHAESNYTAPELKAALKQAIADVESCLEADKKLEGL